MKTEILSRLLIPFLGTSLGAACVLFITVLMKHTEKNGCVRFTAGNTRITASVSTAVFRGKGRGKIDMTSKEYKDLPIEKRGFC